LGVGAAAVVAVVAGLGVYLQQARQAASALALDVEANLWLQRSAAALASGQPDRALAQAAQAYAVLPSEKTRSAVWQAGVAMAPALAFSFPAVARDGTPARATTVGAVSALAWEASMEGLLMGDRAGTLQGLRFTPTPALTALAAERRGPPSKDRPEAVLALQRLADGSLLAVLEDGRILRQRSAGAPFDLAGQVDALAAAAVNETGDGLLVLTQSARQAHWVRCAPGGGCRLQQALSGLGAVTTIALEARSGQLVVADESGRLLVGSSAEPAALRPVRVDWPAATRVHALALRADGQRLAVAGSTGEVVVLDADDRELTRLSTQGAAVQRLAWSPDGRLLAGDCEVESLCVWRSAADGSLSLATVLAVRGGGAGALAWSGDARRLAAGDLGGRLHVWDLAAAPGRAAVLRAAGVGPLADIDVHADGRRIVAADVRGRAVVWDLPSQQVQQRLAHALAGETRSVRFHPVQPRLALATLGGGVAVLGLDAAAEPTLLEGSIEVLRWQPATGRLLTGGQDGVLRSHAVGTGQAEVLPEPHADAVIALAVAPAAAGSAPLVYTADTRGVVRSHGAETATVATAVNAAGRPFGVGSLSFSADGNAWLASGNSGEVLIFDRASRQLRARLDTGADQVNAAAYSPDGRYVAAIDNVGRLHVWHADTLRALASLWLRNEPGRVGTDSFGLVGQLRGLAWLPDSRRVAIASQSGVVLVLAVPTEDGLPTAR
jgi:WD40 repeat protein